MLCGYISSVFLLLIYGDLNEISRWIHVAVHRHYCVGVKNVFQRVLIVHAVKAFVVAVSKIRKNIYRSDVQVTFELYGHFRCLQFLYSK